VNENGFSQLYLLNTNTNQFKKVPEIPVGQINSLKFHPELPKLAMVLNTTQTPGDVFTLDLNSFQKERWTESEVGGLDTKNFPVPELLLMKHLMR